MTGPSAQNTSVPAGPFADRRIYFIGIGGCGISGLARLLSRHGASCSGSDVHPTEVTTMLAGEGINVRFNQRDGLLPHDCDVVITSAAIPHDHPELLAAQLRDVPVYTYAEALGMVQSLHTGISIAGTHGKSTTVSMLSHVLIETGLDPSFIVGALCPQIGGGSRVGATTVPGDGQLRGKPGLLVAEACEFNRSFHHHRPTIGLINNIEEDHLDIYGSLDAVIEAFAGFAQLIPSADQGGRLLIAHDGAHRRQIASGLDCEVATFGFNPAADYQIVFDSTNGRVQVVEDQRPVCRWVNRMAGEHNGLNAGAAAILANWLGAEWEDIGRALETFEGIDRRMQRLGLRAVNGGDVTVYDDYGHHPTEIESTLQALRVSENPDRLICVFQPHQHSRTRFLLEQFAQSFSNADVVIVPHIYFVRDSELEKQRVDARDLVDRLRKQGVMAMHLYPFDAIVEQLEVICRPGDLVVIMGAGPVWQVARAFLSHGRDSRGAVSAVG